MMNTMVIHFIICVPCYEFLQGKDIRLLLEGDTLKLAEPRTKNTMLIQPVSKMRVWGVGKEDQRY